MAKVGAPLGGRVHWLLYHLPRNIARDFRLYMDYDYHNYMFMRFPIGKRNPRDLFIIIRTSRKCFRCMYFHFEYNYFEYFSERTSRKMAEHMERVYLKILKSEHENRLTDF